MKKNETKTKSPLDELSDEEIKELQEIYEQRKIKFGADSQKTGALNQPIYNFFSFIIGGPNQSDIANEQQGKPNQPPY